MPRFGDTIAQPAFPDDDGSAPVGLVAALSDAGGGAAQRVLALRALAASRLLVAVVAVLDERDSAAGAHPGGDKASHMAAVLLTGRDGRRALLGFTGLDSMRAWNPHARPVAVSGRDAARSAMAQAEALLVDLGSPWTLAVQGDDLAALAAGLLPAVTNDGGYVWLPLDLESAGRTHGPDAGQLGTG